MSASKYHVPNLERAIQILDALSKEPKGLTQKELIDTLEISKNSVYRIAATLINHGYIGRDEVSRKYFLTRKMMIQGATAMGDQNIVARAHDMMVHLRDTLNASVFLGVLDGTGGVIIEQVIGGSPFKFSVDLGTRFRLHCSAPGKAFLATLPEQERDELISKIKLPGFTGTTLTSKAQLRTELEQVKKQGYAIDHAEEFEGCHCIGSVIRDHRDYPIAAVWVSTTTITLPQARFEEVGQIIKESVDRISEKFGCKLG